MTLVRMNVKYTEQCFQDRYDAVLKANTCYSARIPRKDVTRESVVLPAASFRRITSQSRLLSSDTEALKQEHWREKEEKMVGSTAETKTGLIMLFYLLQLLLFKLVF